MKTSIALLLLLCSGLAAGEGATLLVSDQTRAAGLPFSDARRVGNILFLSGQMGFPARVTGSGGRWVASRDPSDLHQYPAHSGSEPFFPRSHLQMYRDAG